MVQPSNTSHYLRMVSVCVSDSSADANNNRRSRTQQAKTERRTTPKLKVLAIVCLMVVAWFANDFALAWIHERVPETDPLPDVVFDLVPEIGWASTVAEVCTLISGLSILFVFAINSERWTIAARVLYITAVVYFGRALCISVTQLPLASNNTFCAPKLQPNEDLTFAILMKRTFRVMVGLGFEQTGLRHTCGDLIYSGHTIALVMGYLTAQEYLPKRLKNFGSGLLWLVMVSGMASLIVCRFHYTVDVLLAYYISSRMFYWYHLTVQCPEVRVQDENYGDLISKVFWFPFIKFIEGRHRVVEQTEVALRPLTQIAAHFEKRPNDSGPWV